jgi:hypothetical protein
MGDKKWRYTDCCRMSVDDWEPSPEQIAKIKRAMQEANDGLTYTMLFDEREGHKWDMKCNPCGRVGNLMEKPFPHKLNCPMRRLSEVKD